MSMITAYGRNREIGLGDDLPWGRTMPADLKHFRDYIDGKTIIGGRVTIEPLITRLPAARIIALTRDHSSLPKSFNKIDIADSLEDALSQIDSREDTVVIGGEQIYRHFMPFVSKVIATEIEASFPGSTAFFPILPKSWWYCQNRDFSAFDGSKNAHPATIATYVPHN